MKYTIYKNEVGQLLAMEGWCEFDGVIAQVLDKDLSSDKYRKALERIELECSRDDSCAWSIANEALE